MAQLAQDPGLHPRLLCPPKRSWRQGCRETAQVYNDTAIQGAVPNNADIYF